MRVIDATGLSFRELNEKIRNTILNDHEFEIELTNVNGQRYIGDGLNNKVKMLIHGVPGNDLGAFMNGASIVVYGNAEDAVGNTMNAGKIVVHGSAGDIIGYSMRGGKIYLKGNAGYRVGIHMKEYGGTFPAIVVGGFVRDFAGEYMAGGRLVILGSQEGKVVGNYVGTGMHGGKIYVRGKVEARQVATGVDISELADEDKKELTELLDDYCKCLGLPLGEVLSGTFLKIAPKSHRPYGKTYALE